MTLQHLRSSTASKRPLPGSMSDGQLAVNTNVASPGLFFKDSTGELIKIGPVHIGTAAPNSSPAAGGETGNAVGEQWLDTTGGGYSLKIWDGSAWRSEAGEFVNVTSATGSAELPVGTTAQRDGSPSAGYIRFNSTDGSFEGYDGTQWGSIGGGASGGGGDAVFYENDQTVTTDYTITSSRNAMTAGPVTINSGITVTIPSGSSWVVV